jgi:DNA polymerase-3 subunit delta'
MSKPIHPAFASIVGQGRVIEFLSRAIDAGRLPHALIFSGPIGVGRGLTARALASILLTADRSDIDAIETTRRHLLVGTHPDFHQVNKEMIRLIPDKKGHHPTELGVDVIREFLIRSAARKSVSGPGKVFVVEQADLMSSAAQNALLKVFEEPPAGTYVILLAEQSEALLPTIRSRAQLLRFTRLTDREALAVVMNHGRAEGSEAGGLPASQAVALANGSPGLALGYLRDGIPLIADSLFKAVDAAGGDDWEPVATLLAAQVETLTEQAVARDPLASKDLVRRDALGTLLGLLADRCRSRMRAFENPDDEDTAQSETELECRKIEAIGEAERLVNGNVNVSLVIRQVASRLAFGVSRLG